MAKSKAKKAKNVKKKVSSYDDKLIKIIGASLAGVVVLLVAVIAIVSFNSGYVCKVGGSRVMDYEYRLFLGMAMEQMEEDAEKALEDGKEFNEKEFWTDEKRAEAMETALNDVSEWKANYLIAKKEGYGLNYKERNEYAATLDSNLQYMYYYQTQSSSSSTSTMTYDQFLNSYLSGMSLKEYTKYAIQDKAITDYRAALEETYSPTDAQLNEKYDSDKDLYRKILLDTIAYERPTKPDEDRPTAEDEPKKPEGAAEDSTEYKNWVTEKEKYDKLVESWKTYDEEDAELKAKVDAIYKALSETGKYTGEGVKDAPSASATATVKPSSTASATATAAPTATPEATATPEVTTEPTAAPSADATADANATATAAPSASATATATPAPKNEFKDATLKDIAKQESDLFSSYSGRNEFNSESDTADLILDDYALSLEWTSDERKDIVSTVMDNESFKTSVLKYDDAKTYAEGKVTCNIVLLTDDTYYYISQCVGIKDMVTNAEPWETGETDDEGNPEKEDTCVRDTVKDAVLSDMSEAELKSLREGKYSKKAVVKSKKDELMSEIAATVLPTTA